MIIAWNHFSPISALAGGAVIGLAVASFAVFNGRATGISGIAGGLLTANRGDTLWRVAFISGLAAAPWLYQVSSVLPEIRIDSSWPLLALSGLLVGVGTRLGSGCTSGHGICGLSRLSPRSTAATLTFMASAAATVFLVRHVLQG